MKMQLGVGVGENVFKKHDMGPNIYIHTQQQPGENRQHHGQCLTRWSPIRAAVTRQPVRQTLTAGLDEDREPQV